VYTGQLGKTLTEAGSETGGVGGTPGWVLTVAGAVLIGLAAKLVAQVASNALNEIEGDLDKRED
jgi:hypothetical protein